MGAPTANLILLFGGSLDFGVDEGVVVVSIVSDSGDDIDIESINMRMNWEVSCPFSLNNNASRPPSFWYMSGDIHQPINNIFVIK